MRKSNQLFTSARNSCSAAIAGMQPADQLDQNNLTTGLHRAWNQRILAEAHVRSPLVVIDHVLAQDTQKLRFAEGDDVISAFSSYATVTNDEIRTKQNSLAISLYVRPESGNGGTAESGKPIGLPQAIQDWRASSAELRESMTTLFEVLDGISTRGSQ